MFLMPASIYNSVETWTMLCDSTATVVEYSGVPSMINDKSLITAFGLLLVTVAVTKTSPSPEGETSI